MADHSAIEWTDATWNPTVGCSIVSPGCTNCYAMNVAAGLERRFGSEKYRGLTKRVNGNNVWTGEVRLDEAALLQPLKWKKGRRIFVNSMSDLFHESLSDEQIDRMFAVMALAPQHAFQVLTKRADRMRAYCASDSTLGRVLSLASSWLQHDGICTAQHIPDGLSGMQLPNVWLGVSAERQEEADERIAHLVNTPAAVRFVSVEPLLAPLSFRWAKWHEWTERVTDHLDGLRMLDWIIVGGESGKNARPMHPDWARSLRDQCEAAGVPFFFKQWGEWTDADGRGVDMLGTKDSPLHKFEDGKYSVRVGKKAAGRLLDGKTYDAFPMVKS